MPTSTGDSSCMPKLLMSPHNIISYWLGKYSIYVYNRMQVPCRQRLFFSFFLASCSVTGRYQALYDWLIRRCSILNWLVMYKNIVDINVSYDSKISSLQFSKPVVSTFLITYLTSKKFLRIFCKFVFVLLPNNYIIYIYIYTYISRNLHKI